MVPYPITQYSTVYSALRNFEDVRKQLGQEYINFKLPSEFKRLFPMIVLQCAGIYFKVSGIDTALILSKCFGKDTIDSILSGGHCMSPCWNAGN